MWTLNNFIVWQNISLTMDRRRTNSQAVVAERSKIVLLWMGGTSAKLISKQTGASLSTVYRWIRRWQEEGSVKTRPYHRRLRSTPWTCERNIIPSNIEKSSWTFSSTANFPEPATTLTSRRDASHYQVSKYSSHLPFFYGTLATKNKFLNGTSIVNCFSPYKCQNIVKYDFS